MKSLREIGTQQSSIIDRLLADADRPSLVFPADGGEPKRVANWSWLRRQAQGFDGNLLHPMQGVAFAVRVWHYGKARHLGGGLGPLHVPHERFDPILIAYLRDGRIFADQWASASVLYDSIGRWRNVQGYLIDWQSPIAEGIPTCAIGGKDWQSIADVFAEHHRRVMRERELAAAR